MTNFYQVVERIGGRPLASGSPAEWHEDKATNIHTTLKAAKAEAKKRRFRVGSDIIMTRVLGHWDMVRVIQHLLNNPPCPSYRNMDGMLSDINLPNWGEEALKEGKMNECTYPGTQIYKAGQAQKVIGKL